MLEFLISAEFTEAAVYGGSKTVRQMLQTFHLSHLPPALAVHIALFRDVRNASYLRQQLIDGKLEFEYAFIDASVIVSTTHALAAVFRAVNDLLNDRLKSRNVHSEIVFSLSPKNNISESFRRFGVSDITKDLLVVKVGTTPNTTHEIVEQHLGAVIEGRAVAFLDEELQRTVDLARVRKIYKLTSTGDKGKKSKDQSVEQRSDGVQEGDSEAKTLEIAILGMIALRGAS